MKSTQERVAVVTGAGRGIGRAIALKLGAAGFAVAVWDLDETTATETAGEMTRAGGKAIGCRCDVSDRESVARAGATTREKLGIPWALVNNVGTDRPAPFKDSNPEDWEFIFRVNLFGALHCTQALLANMLEAGSGRIVCISSDAARVGSSGQAVYAASKAALLGFTKTLAREVARKAITVNAICPGPTDTELLDVLRRGPGGERIVEAMSRAVPLGRIAQPDDIAGAVAFFLSDDAGYITGQTLSVSGGLTMA